MQNTQDLNNLYKRLNESIKSEQDEEILRLSDQILQQVPDDSETILCKSISLIKLSKYDIVIQFLQNKIPKATDHNILYSYAYSKYKLNNFSECLDIIKKTNGSPHFGFGLLEAQILFKQGRYEESFDRYAEIIDKKQYLEENLEDIIVNMLCSSYYCNKNKQEKAIFLIQNFIKKSEIIREIFFNLSLVYQNLDNFDKTKEFLMKFKNLISEDEEDFNDLIMSQIQSDFLDEKLYNLLPENIENKINFYTKCLEKHPNMDSYLKSLLNNNLICLKTVSKNDFNVQEILKNIDEIIEKDKNLNKNQLLSLKLNKFLITLYKNRHSESGKILNDIESTFPKDLIFNNKKYILAKYFWLYKSKNFKKIEEFTNEIKNSKHFENQKNLKITIMLANCEISRLMHKSKETIDSLLDLKQIIPSLNENSRFLEFIFSLISENNQIFNDSIDLLEQIVKNTNEPDILIRCAEIFMKKEQYNKASEIYQRLYDKKSNNLSILHKLVYCYSFFDPSKLSHYVNLLPKPTPIIDLNELKKLEKDFSILKAANLKQPGSPKASSPKNKVTIISKTIKKKKKKLPKNFDPNNPGPLPDPERWLPLYQRSKYKKKGKKAPGRGTQGEATGKDSINTFKNVTANQEISSQKNKPKKKGKKH